MGWAAPRLSGGPRRRGRCILKHFAPDPLEAAALLARAADKLAQVDDEDLAIIGLCLRTWLAGDAPDLDAALGVGREPSRRDVRTIRSLIRRDELVREAVRAWNGVEPFVRALARYRAGAWIRDRVERYCPPRLTNKPEALLWAILRERDRDLKRSAVHAIVRNAP